MLTVAAERNRVADHLQRAEAFAASRDLSSLSPVQRLVRELLLQELSAYRADGRFPKNPGFAELTPTFVDAEGTRCAMAQLLELGGEHAMVKKISTERNHARVKDLADEPGLLAWLEAAGLTVEEAAVIQPGYGCTSAAECVCREGFSQSVLPVPAKAVLEVTMLEGGVGQVDAVYGTTNFKVGDQLRLPSYVQAVGGRAIVGLDADDAMVTVTSGGVTEGDFAAVPLTNGKWQCDAMGSTTAQPITTAEYARIAMADDCLATARATPGLGGECGPAGGCSAAGDAGSLGVLLAVVGALMARRLGR